MVLLDSIENYLNLYLDWPIEYRGVQKMKVLTKTAF